MASFSDVSWPLVPLLLLSPGRVTATMLKPGTVGSEAGGGMAGLRGKRGVRLLSDRMMDLPVAGSWPGAIVHECQYMVLFG